MNVKDIIKLTCEYLQLDDLINSTTLGGQTEPTEETTKNINLLLSCVNLVNNIIAGEYIRLYKTVKISSVNGLISYNNITSEKLNDIYSVKDSYGNKLIYKTYAEHLKTIKGEVEIIYSYFPPKVMLEENITHFNRKISDRVYAYGVASEYCFINGLYDDATMWDIRFKNSLTVNSGKKGEISMKPRRWL